MRRHKAGKFALVYHRTNTVDVPGVEIHKDSIPDSVMLLYHELHNSVQVQDSLVCC